MKQIDQYKKIWWLHGALLGGVGATVTYVLQGYWTFKDVQNVGLIGYFLSPEVVCLIAVASLLTGLFFLPIFFVSDLVFANSVWGLCVSILGICTVLPTLILTKFMHHSLDFNLLRRGWNFYLYVFEMGVLCFAGWMKSRKNRLRGS